MASGAKPGASGGWQESGVAEPASRAGRGRPRTGWAVASNRTRVLRWGSGARDAKVARGAVVLTRCGGADVAAKAPRLARKAVCGTLSSSIRARRAGGARRDGGMVK